MIADLMVPLAWPGWGNSTLKQRGGGSAGGVNTLNQRLTANVLAMLLTVLVGGAVLMHAQQSQRPAASNAAVPDAPIPQSSAPLSGLKGQITPGKGEGAESSKSGFSSGSAQPEPAASPAPSVVGPDMVQTAPPELPAIGEGVDQVSTFVVNVNYVDLPVTVKDSKGNLVAGLTYRDFRVFENGAREPLRMFTVDPFPLSIAFVVDQSVTSDVMAKVNGSLGAIQNALTPYDEVAVFSYNNGPEDRSHGFTGAQSARLPYVLSMLKNTGREMLVPVNSGPMAGCNIRENGACVDPNLQPGRSAGDGPFMMIPKEVHTLNDAVLAAAKVLSTRPKGRRRLIYVISDGKEYGSKASYKEVVRYLQTNKIAVYGTLVGDSARWGEGYISRFHIPYSVNDNILIKYTHATGGTLDSERNLNGIEKSYAKIAEEARTQYTLGYISHQPVIDGKFRQIDVRVDRPSLEVITKIGYFPSAQDLK